LVEHRGKHFNLLGTYRIGWKAKSLHPALERLVAQVRVLRASMPAEWEID
jgi:hypothetical protein